MNAVTRVPADAGRAARRRLIWTGYAATTLLGLYIAALGPGLTGLAARTHTPVAETGSLFTALFGGGLAITLAAGRTMDRVGRRPLLLAGSSLNGSGALLLLLARTWPQVLAGGVLLGMGDGTLVVALHVLFADLHPESGGAALNRLNVFFGLGALAGPLLAGASILATGDIGIPLGLVAAGQAIIALVVAGSAFPPRPRVAHGAETMGLRQLVRQPLVWSFALLIFVYVGLEVGLGNWAYTYLRGGGAGVVAASLFTALFWSGLTAGRLASPLLLRRLAETQLLLCTVVAAALAALLLVAIAVWRPGGAVIIVLIGVCFGPVWPLVFAIATRRFRQGAGSVAGTLTTAGAVGGLAGPWLQGVLLLEHGSRWGMSFTLAGCAAMLGLALLSRYSSTP